MSHYRQNVRTQQIQASLTDRDLHEALPLIQRQVKGKNRVDSWRLTGWITMLALTGAAWYMIWTVASTVFNTLGGRS